MSVNVGMNKHIEVVKKWLADKESVTREELDANVESASAANAADAYAASAAAYAATAGNAASAAAAWCEERAKYWVEQYEELAK